MDRRRHSRNARKRRSIPTRGGAGPDGPKKPKEELDDSQSLKDNVEEQDNGHLQPKSSVSEKEDVGPICWPKADLIHLLFNIEVTFPLNDFMIHSRRATHLEWEKITFKNYAPSECERIWKKILEKIRDHRTLKEVLADVWIWLKEPEKRPDVSQPPSSSELNPELAESETPPLLGELQEPRETLQICMEDRKLAEDRIVCINQAQKEGHKYIEKTKLNEAGLDQDVPAKRTDAKDEVLPEKTTAPMPEPANPPKTAFAVYSEIMLEKCAEIISLPYIEQVKELSRRWNKMLPEERVEYREKFELAQAQYEADYRNYIKGLPKEEQQKALQKKRELAKKQKQNQLKRNRKSTSILRKTTLELPSILHDEIGWPKADVIELLSQIEATLPCVDTMHHSTRAEFLDWSQIAFNNYSTEECKRVWTSIHKRTRHFRILNEILADARVWVHQESVNYQAYVGF